MLNKKIKSFVITIEVLNGKHVGTLLNEDKFHCAEQGKYYWKFQKLFKAIGITKYDENINLEGELLNK